MQGYEDGVLAHRPGGVPGLYRVLSAEFHLERLQPDDYARLDAVAEQVWSWLGPQLRWHFGSSGPDIEPIRREDLDYMPGLCDRLHEPVDLPAAWFEHVNPMRRFSFTDYEVSAHGGIDPFAASPFLFRFWAEVDIEADVDDGIMPCDAVLRICVPESWDLSDFLARVQTIAGHLRLAWGSAGYSYSFWIPGQLPDIFARMRGHARRFVGYDLPWFVRAFPLLRHRIRSINWLTWLGPEMVRELVVAGVPLQTSPLITVQTLANGTTHIRAGDAPERGDVNRLQHPRAYVEADALLRPVRLDSAEDLTVYGDWSERELNDWLLRYERLTN